MTGERQWYVKRQNVEHGPFTSKQLKELATTRQITEQSPVRLGMDGAWTTAGNVRGLFSSKGSANEVTTQRLPVAASTQSKATPQVNPVVEQEIAGITAPASVASPAIREERLPCPFCGEPIVATAIKCRHCNEFLDGRRTNQVAQAVPMATPAYVPMPVYAAAPSQNVNVVLNQQLNVGYAQKRWSPVVAALLSFIMPGLGQLYKGQVINAVAWFCVVAIGYIAFMIPGLILHVCCVMGAAMGDPYR